MNCYNAKKYIVIGQCLIIFTSVLLNAKTFVVGTAHSNLTTAKINATEQLIQSIANHTNLLQPDKNPLPFLANMLSSYIAFDTAIKRKTNDKYQWYINSYVGNVQLYNLVQDMLIQMQQVHIYTSLDTIKEWIKNINILIRIVDMLFVEEYIQPISDQFIDRLQEQKQRFKQLLLGNSVQLDIIILPAINEENNDTLHINNSNIPLKYGQHIDYIDKNYIYNIENKPSKASLYNLLLNSNSSYFIAVNKKDYLITHKIIFMLTKSHKWLLLRPMQLCTTDDVLPSVESINNTDNNQSVYML